MSREHYPAARLALLPEAGAPDGHRKTQLIFHSTGTSASASANLRYFARQDVKVESTFLVDYDGTVWQAMNASDKADANTSASTRAMSVEVVGTGDEPYTPEQVRACIGIARWAATDHGIPSRPCPKHDAPGIGYHVQFGAPGPWTSVVGKVCPGRLRTGQVLGEVIPGAAGAAAPTTTPAPITPTPEPEEDDEMTPQQFESLVECRRMLAVLLGAQDPATPGETRTLTQIAQTHENAAESRRMAGVLLGALPPVGSERLGVATDVDVDALATRLAQSLGPVVAGQVGQALVRGAVPST